MREKQTTALRPLLVTEEQADLLTRLANRRFVFGGIACGSADRDTVSIYVPETQETAAGGGVQYLLAQLTAATILVGGTPRYGYDWAECVIRPDGTVALADGGKHGEYANGTHALNLEEVGAVAWWAGTQPNGIQESRLPHTVRTWSVLGENGSAIVVVRLFSLTEFDTDNTATPRMYFERSAPLDGTC